MGLKDHKPIKIDEFESLYARGVSGTSYNPIDATPINGLTTADNIRFFPWGVARRPGYAAQSVLTFAGSIFQVLPYNTNLNVGGGGITSGYLIVSNNAGVTNVYSSNSPTPNVAISSIAGNAFISMIVIFGRVYFTYHDYATGRIATSFQVYIPGQTASRANGGNGPSLAGINFASSGTAGIVTQGVHVFGVAYETSSGHITALSTVAGTDVGFFTLANANQQVTVTGLPNPLPANITKTYVLASRLIVNSSGVPADYELFFVTNPATGNPYFDTGTGTLTFNFSDESLQDSADYLYDIFGSMYSGLGFTWYANRMISWGEAYNGGAELGPSVLRVSESGKPETFSLSHGFVEIFRDDGSSGVKNAFEYKGLLIVQKENKTFVTRDNGDHPNTWQVDILDGVIGGIVNGSVKSLDSVGNIKSDYTISITKSGVYLFDGKYSDIPLTWKIERLWQGYAEDEYYPQYQILDIPSAKLFLVHVRDTGETTFTRILACDYSRGLTYDTVRWSSWTVGNSTSMQWLALKTNTQIWIVTNNAVKKMDIGTESSDATTNEGSQISGTLVTAELPFGDELELNNYTLARMQGVFTAMSISALKFIDDLGVSTTLTAIPAALANSGDITQVILKQKAYLPRLSFTVGGATGEFALKRLIIYGSVYANNMPNP